MKNSAAKTTLLIGIIFFLVGLGMLGVGVFLHIDQISFGKNAVETEAIITEITTSRHTSGGKTSTSHTVYVEYRVDDTIYSGTLGYYSSGMHEGQKVTIQYDPNDPSNFRNTSSLPYLLLCLFGVVFGGVGFGLLFSSIKQAAKQKKLLKNGRRITGTVTEIKEQLNVRINGRHPLIVECQAEDLNTNEILLFASKGYTTDKLYSAIGLPVDIYFDPANPKENFVDVPNLLKQMDAGAIGTGTTNIHDYR